MRAPHDTTMVAEAMHHPETWCVLQPCCREAIGGPLRPVPREERALCVHLNLSGRWSPMDDSPCSYPRIFPQVHTRSSWSLTIDLSHRKSRCLWTISLWMTTAHGQRGYPCDGRTCMASGDVETWFVDTNVLVYANMAQAPLHAVALMRLQEVARTGAPLWVSRQVLREYLAVVTRPQRWSAPQPLTRALARVRYFQRRFQVADETAVVTARLLTLLRTIPAGGAQIHDANIVATMQAYGIQRLLTENVADFARFSGVITIVPLVVHDSSPPAHPA